MTVAAFLALCQHPYCVARCDTPDGAPRVQVTVTCMLPGEKGHNAGRMVMVATAFATMTEQHARDMMALLVERATELLRAHKVECDR